MNESADEPTQVFKLSPEQVRNALMAMVKQLQRDFPCEQDQWDNAYIISKFFERTLIRKHVVPHIQDCMELSWLEANDVHYVVKSSIDQLLDHNLLRIQITSPVLRCAFNKWRNAE